MNVYNTPNAIIVEYQSNYYELAGENWDEFINQEQVRIQTLKRIQSLTPIEKLPSEILAPIGSQEVWAAGVTYFRSRTARMEESESGGSFYDKVYEADRPELFFKSQAYRVVPPSGLVRIRKDSTWDVPEPELTLCINAKGELIGYTIGNDMSSRSIEGENPLYLPQAKSYTGSAALGPCLYLAEDPFSKETTITLTILRKAETVFTGSTQVNQIKRSFEELIGYLTREISFPTGCYLMTGTGIVPPNEFTLQSGDEIRIQIEPMGTLINTVA